MIDHIDAENRIIYLDSSTVNATIQPIDIYREMRELRRTNESLRPYDVFMTMKGAEKKNPDGSKRTERYLVLLNGTLIAPYDTSHTLTIDGTIITDDGLEGVECFNRAYLSINVEVNINYVPKQVEVITVNSSGSTISPADVWNYNNRTLTNPVNTTESSIHTALDTYANKDQYNTDLSTIPADVWNYITRELTIAAGLTAEQEEKIDQIIKAITNKETFTSNDRALLNNINVNVSTVEDKINNIPTKVWEYEI